MALHAGHVSGSSHSKFLTLDQESRTAAAAVSNMRAEIVRPSDLNLDYFEVTGVNGSTVDKRVRVWSTFWEEVTGRNMKTCQIYNCGEPAFCGGHMHMKRKRDHFILPICREHNNVAYGYEARGGPGHWMETKKDAVAVRIDPHPGTFA